MEVRCHGRLTAFRIGTIRRANQRRVNTLISGRLQVFRRGDRTCRQRSAVDLESRHERAGDRARRKARCRLDARECSLV